jgi:hypothetical protein
MGRGGRKKGGRGKINILFRALILYWTIMPTAYQKPSCPSSLTSPLTSIILLLSVCLVERVRIKEEEVRKMREKWEKRRGEERRVEA